MTIGTDTDAFFRDDFAVTVTYDGDPFPGILDEPYADESGIAGQRFAVTVPMAELPAGADATGQVFAIGSRQFRTLGPARVGVDQKTGRFDLVLLGAGTLEIGATSTYLRRLVPTANYSDQPTVRLTAGLAGEVGLLQFDLAAIPAGATVTAATVTATVAEAGGTTNHDLEAAAAVPPLEIAEATWNEYAAGSAWVEAGAQNIPGDKLTPPLGDQLGDGAVADDVLTLAEGAAALAWVEAAQADDDRASLVLTVETGFLYLHSANSANPPTLALAFEF